jgi:NADH-quinone oxidoreductase subunit H
MSVIDSFTAGGSSLLGPVWPLAWTMIKILCVLLPLMGLVAYATLWERKLIGWIQIRVGPNRVGPGGLLQPIADALKLLLKEIVVPAKANGKLFILGPIMTIMPALAAWSVVPFGPEAVLANVNAGLLVLMAITSIEVYGIIIAGWASNSKYSFLGAMRASAQMISYEIPMGFVFVVILMISGSLNFADIVATSSGTA